MISFKMLGLVGWNTSVGLSSRPQFASWQTFPALDATLHPVRHAQVSSHGLQLWSIIFMFECCEAVHASGLRFAQNTVWPLKLRQRAWHQAVNCVHAQPTLLSSIPVSDGMIAVMVKSCQPSCLSLCGSPEALAVSERSDHERQLTQFCLPQTDTSESLVLSNRKRCWNQKSRLYELINMLLLG